MGRSAARVQRVQRVQKVQRGRWTAPTEPRVLKILRFDGPLARGLWYRPSGDEFYNSAPRNGKPYNRADARRKCTPFGTFSTTFPPEGELLAVQCIEVLMRPKAERKANFPLRGKSPQGNRGAFPSRHRRGRMVFPLLLPNMQIISPAQRQRGPGTRCRRQHS